MVCPAANEEYYQLLMSREKHSCGPDVPSYTIEEIQSATSEVIMKSTVSVSWGESSSGELETAWPVA